MIKILPVAILLILGDAVLAQNIGIETATSLSKLCVSETACSNTLISAGVRNPFAFPSHDPRCIEVRSET